MKRVYISGPYSNGDRLENVRNAVEAAEKVLRAGFWPYVPHLTHYWHEMYPHEYEEWLRLDLAFLEVCDFLVRLPGESPGAVREVERAKKIGLPVFFGLDAFLEAAAGVDGTDAEELRVNEIKKFPVIGYVVTLDSSYEGKVRFVPVVGYWGDEPWRVIGTNEKIIGVVPAQPGTFAVMGFVPDDGASDQEKLKIGQHLGYEFPGGWHPNWLQELKEIRRCRKTIIDAISQQKKEK